MKKIFVNKIGKIICFLIGVYFVYMLSINILISIHNFLAINKPVKAVTLIIEGWLFDYMLEDAVKEIEKNNYSIIITTGIDNQYYNDSFCNGLKNTAECCKKKLTLLGINPSIIHPVSAGDIDNDHTYNTALAIREWLVKKNIKAVNVFTGGPHGKKSQILFQKALGNEIKVGIISCKIQHYDPVYWWTSKRGTSVTLRYFVGYIYALLK